MEPRAVGCEPIQRRGEEGGGGCDRHEKYEEGRRKRSHDVSKSPTVPAEHKGGSAIPDSSATGDNYFTDRPRLKDRPLTGEGFADRGVSLKRAQGEEKSRTQPTPRNRLARPDHQK